MSYQFNNDLEQFAADANLSRKVVVSNHNLECDGAVREARYKDTKSGRFNGVNLYGPSGKKAYTSSLLNILKSANLVKAQPPKYYDELSIKPSVASRRGNRNYNYSIPTQNRFQSLADLDSGN